ncbi:MAG: Flp pilus assembly complex ATPase component TadA [Planctomycetaceae bacterium]|nr:Flp pilus assembly complex ATPase component TadA [Planctomycetaceae bacterium]
MNRPQGQPPQNAQPEIQVEQIMLLGPLFGLEADLKANGRLVQAALSPAKQMLSDALARRAHTILLEPAGNRLGIRFVVDGVPYPAAAIPAQKGVAMVQMLKLLAGLDIQIRDQAQKGGIKAEFDKIPYHLIIETAPARSGGERLRIKVENQKVQLLKPTDVGLPESIRERIREFTSHRSGVVLVCGPPESGVTTLSVVTVHTVDPYLYAVFSMADVEGRQLTNVTDYKPDEGHDLEITFDRLIRREADVVFLNPLNSPQEAQVVFEYADRLSFIAEIRSGTPTQAVEQLIEWVGREAVVKGLKGVLCQKMIRRLCDDCKQAFRPNPQLLKKLRMPPETSVLYRAPLPPPPDDPTAPTVEQLCADCAGMPYHGRIGVFELLEVTDTMKEVIAEGGDAAAFRKQMIAEDMTTLQKDALRVVLEGKTSLEEVQRVFAPPRPRGAPKRRPQPPQ